MAVWAVQILSDDAPFQAELLITAPNIEAAIAQAQEKAKQLYVGQELGPYSWHYCRVIVGTTRQID